LLLDPFDVTASRRDVYCHAWTELETCLLEHAAGLSLPETVVSPLDVIPAALRHRLRLQYCFHALPDSGYEHLTGDDPDGPICRFVNDLRESPNAIEQLDLTFSSLLTMVKLPEEELPHFVRVMNERLGIESPDERMAKLLFCDSLEHATAKPAEGNHPGLNSGGWPEFGSALRLPVESIKRAILHPNSRIREMAVHYFADTYTSDRSIMPLVIEALEEHGKVGAYMLVGAAVKLPQTPDTIAWVIRELNDERSASYDSYTYNLERVLCSADPRLLQPCEGDIAATLHLTPGAFDIVSDRIEMLSWGACRCWRELEEHCEQHQCASYADNAELARAGRIVEALARHEVADEMVLDLLSRQVDPHEDTPMKWMEPMAVRLAGRLRLEAAVPLLIGKMRLDDDLLPHECEVALTRVGGDAAVRAVADAFVGAESGFRLVATGVLEAVHTDLAVQSTLRLLVQESDAAVECRLRSALLAQYTPAAIEPARKCLLERGCSDLEDRCLRDDLLRRCEVLGQTFPEYEQWRSDHEREERERLRMVEESKNNPMAGLLYAMEQLTGKKASDVVKENAHRTADRAVEMISPPPAYVSRGRIGRNEPCPCGSGKKYKRCCMRK
jgi:hypothetical protein